jgi:tRNA wybutosine-synthesizing protein 1
MSDVVMAARAALTFAAPLCLALAYRLWRRSAKGGGEQRSAPNAPPRTALRILFATVTGSCRQVAQLTAAEARRLGIDVAVSSIAEYDADWLTSESVVLIVLPTYSHGRPPPDAEPFFDALVDAVSDFRVEAHEFKRLAFALFGAGSSAYGAQQFNAAARQLDSVLGKLGARRLLACTDGDSAAGELSAQACSWSSAICQLVAADQRATTPAASVSRGVAGADDSDSELDDDQEVMDLEDLVAPAARGRAAHEPAESEAAPGAPKQMVTPSLRKALTKQGYKIIGSHSGVKLCRWTKSMLRGRGGCYKHTHYGIASHRCMEMTPSLACANKCVFCWRHHTQVRPRSASRAPRIHRDCVSPVRRAPERSPAASVPRPAPALVRSPHARLALCARGLCAQPAATEFSWEVDEATGLVHAAIEAHRGMIKEARGIQGAIPERVAEGMDVKHCALSLVGEPIMYPQINAFVAELHRRRISSYLVTNAQFPDALRALCPVTQLYLSIDAPTREQLQVRAPRPHAWRSAGATAHRRAEPSRAPLSRRSARRRPQAVDRPVFADFWERFLECIRILSERKERTVFRLTLVNEWNVSQIDAYADLVQLGQPDFVEIKGVTYCGKSDASPLTIKNCPFHEDVRKYAKDLESKIRALGLDYGIASEHAHSNSMLLAKRSFFVRGKWHTWIDYDRFADLTAEGGPIEATDYMAVAPDWAQYSEHAVDGGFDPGETRFAAKSGKLTKTTGGC